MNLRSLAWALGLLFAPAVVAGPQPVSPGQNFPGPVLTVKAPNSAGWLLGKLSSELVYFGRTGATKSESYIASITLFELPEAKEGEDFLAIITKGAKKDVDSGNKFQDQSLHFEATDARGYPCVLMISTVRDTKARTSLFKHESLFFQVRALYCRMPNKSKAGMVIDYSHRGPTALEDFDAQAQDFIDDVEVPRP